MWLVAAAFLAAGVVIVIAGTKLARVAEELAIVTGMGQALTGAVLLGMTTSLGGTVVSLSAALRGDAELAISNGLGGIAAQTAFLAIADFFHRKANLEHAAASGANILQLGLLISLLGMILMAFVAPEMTVWRVHPVSILLPVAWLLGSIVTQRTQEDPGWRPAGRVDGVESDESANENREVTRSPRRLWIMLAVLGVSVLIGGLALSFTAPRIAEATGLSASAVGALFTATITSLPELVTTVAAVRNGALVLAVGDIIGGNTFDVLFVAVGDVAYREGSIYHAIDQGTVFLLALTILLTAVLAAGLISRERKGIGFEGVSILVLYAAGMVTLATMG